MSLSARQPAWSFLARRLQQLAFRTGKHTVHISSAKKNEERPLSLSKQADTATRRDNADDTGYYIFSAVCARWKDWSVVLAGQLFHDVSGGGKSGEVLSANTACILTAWERLDSRIWLLGNQLPACTPFWASASDAGYVVARPNAVSKKKRSMQIQFPVGQSSGLLYFNRRTRQQAACS